MENTLLELQKIFALQKANRWAVAKSSAYERAEKLLKLKKEIESHEEDLCRALFNDFKKPFPESSINELFPVLDEINFVIKNLEKWMKPRSRCTPITLFPARSEVRFEAKGQVLILAPWNYPFQLVMAPVIAAVAAGNVIMVKPSEKTPQTTRVMTEILQRIFQKNEVAVFDGDYRVAEALLELPFDHIFFTGSTAIGRKVMSAAARHLGSVTLELGGKSPTIVHRDANLNAAAERIAWAKFMNCGQTCVAPDYVFVQEKIAEEFSLKIKACVRDMYGNSEEQREKSEDFARIIDDRAFQRLDSMINETVQKGAHVLIGGKSDAAARYIAPTVLTEVKSDHAVMKEEIFGPILPILTYKELDEAIAYIQNNDKPLSLYVFSESQSVIERVVRETTAGGMVANNLIIHLANSHLPFGGVGASGMGNYHGEYGFKAFSHEKAVMYQSQGGVSHWVFPPYNTPRFKRVMQLLKWLSK